MRLQMQESNAALLSGAVDSIGDHHGEVKT